jgi:hypothetical protein
MTVPSGRSTGSSSTKCPSFTVARSACVTPIGYHRTRRRRASGIPTQCGFLGFLVSLSAVAEAVILRQGDLGFQPELRLPGSVLNMHMRPKFLAGKEIEAIPPDPEDGRTHEGSISQAADFRFSRIIRG